MKTPSKLSMRKKSKRKEDALLLTGGKKSSSSDGFSHRLSIGLHRGEDSRDDNVGNDDDWLPFPYQPSQSTKSSGNSTALPGIGLYNGTKQNEQNPPSAHHKLPLSTSKSKSRSRASRDSKTLSNRGSNSRPGRRDSKASSRDTRDSKSSNRSRIESRNPVPERIPVPTAAPERNVSKQISEDIFHFQDEDSLDNLLAESKSGISGAGAGTPRDRQRSFKMEESSLDSQSQESEDVLNGSVESSTEGSLGLPIDPMFKKRGIVIVDPNRNGEVYRMDEDNKCLTNKDLIIIGQNHDNDDDDDDDQTMMSVLTEVTYKKSKEERVKLIYDNLRSAAAHIPESNTWCNQGCNAFDFSDKMDSEDNIIRSSSQGGGQQLKLGKQHGFGHDTSLFFRSLLASPKDVEVGSFREKISVCITRIYLDLQNNGDDVGLRCTYNEPTLCHDLGVKFREGSDGQAIVVHVFPESTAQRSGVEVGDKLSFAVPLNNTFQGYEKACDFISRLELIGMRTSYREVFDMFLSKTSSGWPVATVFRRKSEGMNTFERLPFGVLSVDLNVDVLRASAFFHEIVTRSREYDFRRESDGIFEVIRGNIEKFMLKPLYREPRESHIRNGRSNNVERAAESFGLNSGDNARKVFAPSIASGIGTNPRPFYFSEARRSSLLTWYTENSQAMIYMRFGRAFGGSGIIISRVNEDSWSAPCALSGNVVGPSFQLKSDCLECMMFIRDPQLVNGLKRGEEITLGGETDRKRLLMITKIADHFCVEGHTVYSVQARQELNEMLYAKSNVQSSMLVTNILEGKIPNPDEAMAFYGALRRLELPSTMYPHPTPPPNLAKFNMNDWKVEESCKSSSALEQPFDDETVVTLRDLLRAFHAGKQIYAEEINEFDVFTQKFKQMLFDGVTIDRTWPQEKNDRHDDKKSRRGPSTAKVTLKLNQISRGLDREDQQYLHFTMRPKGGATDDIIDFGNPSGISKINKISESIDLGDVIKISQNIPRNFLGEQKSVQETRKMRKRFVSIKTKDNQKILFLARTGKDASLISSGLKLISEQRLRRRHGMN
mmetsp:Transcript_15107/g.22638  ORF Transcript_15107/g.22638 Transcript_15107/m.22638 type:complete len:1055 (-) Transcript_15107:117-3281(-)